MLSEPQLDPMGSILAELRTDPDVAALVGDRVRGFEPRGKSATYAGDALGPGSYQPFIVVTAFGVTPHPRVPITFAEYGIRAYGVTAQGAWAVWAAVVKAMHAVGPRISASDLGIYRTFVLQGGDQSKDPDTGQPVVEGTLRVTATLVPVTAGS